MFGIEGKVWKNRSDGSWIVSFPSLDSMTEGDTKEKALEMGADLILTYLESYFEKEVYEGFEIQIIEGVRGQIAVVASDYLLLLSLFLIKQRELASMNLQQAATSLGSKSRNAYKQYEKGRIDPSLGKLSHLLEAVNPNEILCLNTLSSMNLYK